MRTKGELSEAMQLASAETHTLNLKILEEVDQIAKNITQKVIELTPELKRKLT